MNVQVENTYRKYLTDRNLDWNESQELVGWLKKLNPPPDTLTWMRATAFRIGCEFLSDDNDANTALLRTINAMVHAIETTCLECVSYEEPGVRVVGR